MTIHWGAVSSTCPPPKACNSAPSTSCGAETWETWGQTERSPENSGERPVCPRFVALDLTPRRAAGHLKPGAQNGKQRTEREQARRFQPGCALEVIGS